MTILSSHAAPLASSSVEVCSLEIIAAFRGDSFAGCPPSGIARQLGDFFVDAVLKGGRRCRSCDVALDLFENRMHALLGKMASPPGFSKPPRYWYGCVKEVDSLAWKDFQRGRGRPVEARHGPTVPISEIDVSGHQTDVVTEMIDLEFAMAGVNLERFVRSLNGQDHFMFVQSQLLNEPLLKIARHLNLDRKEALQLLKKVINQFRQFADQSPGDNY